MRPRWVTAFLDFPPDRYDAAASFWPTVTGFGVSAPRGQREEFMTLVPPEGRDYLRLQRLGDGPTRLHVDLHVDDLATATSEVQALGATVLDAPEDDLLVLLSPGGFVFCLVVAAAGGRPRPRTWPDGHRSFVDQVCLDIPPSLYDAELDFWTAVTGWSRRDPAPGSEFGRLTPGPDQPLQLLLQRLDDEQDAVTAHLDWSASDHEAELAAHTAVGAQIQGRFEGWTVMRDPAGMTYCVTRRQPGDRPE